MRRCTRNRMSNVKIGKMSSKKKGQRKRKSAGIGDIFEVSEKDLSPEPEECESSEPEAKILKTRNSDVSESRKNNTQHNLNDVVEIVKNNEFIAEIHKNGTVSGENVDLSCVSGSEKNPVHIVEAEQIEQICIGSDEDLIEKSKDTSKNENTVSNLMKANSITTDTENISQEIFTIVDEEDESYKDVIIVCDSSIETTKEDISSNSPQIIIGSTLEDGEVNENTLEKPDTSAVITNPAITIKFSDKSIADTYKLQFYKFIQTFVELEAQSLDDMTISVFRDSNLDSKEWVVLDDTVCMTENKDEEELAEVLPLTPKPESPKKKKKKKKLQQHQETELFVVDTNPGAGPVKTMYSTKFLIDEKTEEEKMEKNNRNFAPICFNCENEHALKDCPLPKNFGRISANRQKFQNKNKSRYHLEEDQKYSYLQPGQFSSGLRKALGLKKHQIPSFVYQMRKIGYPPGWLEEAKLVRSDLAMFDIDGNNVKNTNNKTKDGLDPEKVVNYPGFNVPFEKGFKDEFKFYRVPPFGDIFSRENMIDVFNKLSERQKDDFETRDMDLDNTNDSTGNSTVEDVSKLQSKQLDSSMDSDSNNEISISLQELQRKKDSLLEEIKKSGATIPWDLQSDETSQSNSDDCRTKGKASKNEKEKSEEDIEEETVKSGTTETRLEIKETIEMNESSSTSNTPSNINCVKDSVFGTPILKSSTPYNRLPAADNFTKGVSPVIDFENLPNSTGKYEQMTGVLQKVRNTLKSLQQSKT